MSAQLWLQQLLYRPDVLCAACEAAVKDYPLCTGCIENLARSLLTGVLCPACGQPLDETGACCVCARGFQLRGCSAWYHTGMARQLIHLLKYRQRRSVAVPLARGMAEAFRARYAAEPSAVTWVPMPPSRFRRRGYDHAQVLAAQVAAELALPLVQALERVETDRAISHQVGASAQERMANLRGTFSSTAQARGSLLLIDDVLTTGATAAIASECLMQGGAERVWVLTATRTAAPASSIEGGNEHV